jgi:hypothetical protein
VTRDTGHTSCDKTSYLQADQAEAQIRLHKYRPNCVGFPFSKIPNLTRNKFKTKCVGIFDLLGCYGAYIVVTDVSGQLIGPIFKAQTVFLRLLHSGRWETMVDPKRR